MLVNLFYVFNIIVLAKGLNKALIGQSMIYGLSYIAEKNGNSSSCLDELGMLYNSVEAQKPWSLKVLDASGTPGSGFFYGNNLWLGSYAQCEDLYNTKPLELDYQVITRPNSTSHDYPPYNLSFFVAHFKHNNTMQYNMHLPLEFTVEIGLCGPQSCSTEDLHPLVEQYANHKYLTLQKLYDLNLNLTLIRTVEPVGFWLVKIPKTIVLLTIISIVLIFTVVGTYYDVKQHKLSKNLITGQRNNKTEKQFAEVELVSKSLSEEDKTTTFVGIMKCFSIYSNVKSLVNTDLPPDSVPVIHGLKFFGMLWVILVHAVFFQSDFLDNIAVAVRLSEDFFAQILSNSTYSVDTYFFLSGFILAYLFFKSKPNTQSPDYVKKIVQFFTMLVNRFLRLTPTYMFVVLLTDVLYTYQSKASVLYNSERNDELCPKYWWRNLLYINNLFPRTEMCLSWSWYLSADTQFFAISTFLLILSTIKFQISAVLTVLLIIGNILATTYKSYSIRYIPTLDDQLSQLDAIYDLPWNRIGPYLIGVITGYIFVVKMEKKLKLTKRAKTVLWMLFPLINIWILFTLYSRNLTVEFSAVYMGVSRTLWGVGLAWLLIACCTGNAGILAKFLSFPGWIPLSRLTYCAYLLNPLLANMIYMGSNNSLNSSKASFGVMAQGVAMSTYFLAFFLSVLIESPSILLTKMMFKKLTKQKN